jgi:hypothetical protein
LKNMFKIVAIGLCALSLAACGQRIRFDEAAVEIREAGSAAGVQEAEVPTGRYWNHPWSFRYIVKFPTTIQTYKWNGAAAPSFINKDRVSTALPVSINIQIDPAQADNIVRKYKGSIGRSGGEDGYVLDDVVQGPIDRELKQAFIEEGVAFANSDLYADGGKLLLARVRERVAPKFAADGIMIRDIMSIGPPQLPSDVVAQIKDGVKAVEIARKKEAELAATIAEGKKTVAEAEAMGEARRIAGESIRANPEVVVLEEIRARGRSLCPVGVKTCIIGASAGSLIANE